MAKSQPVGCVVGRDHHDLAENLQGGAEVVALEGGVGLAPQHGGGLGDRSGFGFDLGFELDRRVGEIVALEGFVGGNGGDGQKYDERGCNGSANEREHGETSIPVGRGNPSGAAQDECQNVSRS